MLDIKRIVIRKSEKSLLSKEDIEIFRKSLATLTVSNDDDITFIYEDTEKEKESPELHIISYNSNKNI